MSTSQDFANSIRSSSIKYHLEMIKDDVGKIVEMMQNGEMEAARKMFRGRDGRGEFNDHPILEDDVRIICEKSNWATKDELDEFFEKI